MTVYALAFAYEQGFAAGGIGPGGKHLAGRCRQGTQIRDDGAELRLGHGLRRHTCTGNAIAKNLHDVVIRAGTGKFRVAKIHTGDLVPIRPVAIDAIRDIELVANPDISLGIYGARQFVLGSQ